MKKRLFMYTTLIVFAGLLSFFAVTVYITSANNLSMAKDTVIEMAQIYADLYTETADVSEFASSGGSVRVTVVSQDGVVLADSGSVDASTAENHLDRPEIQAALEGSPAAFVRYSETIGVDFIYYALKVSDGEGYIFIRTAVPVAATNAYLRQSLPPLIMLLAVVAFLCFVLIRGATVKVLKPFGYIEEKLISLINLSKEADGASPDYGGNGDLAERLNDGVHTYKSYEEIEKIVDKIDDVALILQKNICGLNDEKTKLDYIIGNIGDGIFAVSEDRSITLINNAALEIFGVTPDIIGKSLSYLSYEKTLTAAILDSVSAEQNSLFETTVNGRIYLVTVKRLLDTTLTTVILSDVTDSRENAKRREEFFANASHELKTPLAAIKGFNELTEIHNKDENLNKFINGISRETGRMLSLIRDMLKLSELENTEIVNPVPVSLSKIVNEVREALSPAIDEKSLTFEVTGEGETIAEPGHVYDLVKNLVENAIRYNNQGGRISVTVESDKNNSWLFIFDNGIGISPEEQSRIFERFYRVEKSRSGRSGGTGLGLSIVKHVCNMYGWQLLLKSKLGVGTEITVEFIKN